MEPSKITVTEVKKQRERGEPLIFLDVRNPKAWASSTVKLPGAIRMSVDQVEQHLATLPHNSSIVTYCT